MRGRGTVTDEGTATSEETVTDKETVTNEETPEDLGRLSSRKSLLG